MPNRDLFDALISVGKIEELKSALASYRSIHEVKAVPFGRRDNNRGAIEVASDPARSAIERVTNAHDAILEREYDAHDGKPLCRSPREAASSWLGIPEKGGLSGLSPKLRQDLASDTVLRLEPGEGWQSRVLTVIDRGSGIPSDRLESTILSLNESNKVQKHHLAGTYGQGGASTLAFSRYVFIASRFSQSDMISFTVVWYEDLPAETYKTGHYVYLTENYNLPTITAKATDFDRGTIIRHFGYDLTAYTASIGPKSLYGALQRMMFDPVLPIRFENRVAGWNRTIKGARNALNGAIDQGDEASKGPDIEYHLPMFYVSLGDYGDLGVEYWVLSRSANKEGKVTNSKPSRAFVDDAKPIILSHNGQNQDEMSGRLLKKEADLPYLQAQGRLIVHINCDKLSADSKRKLFSSTREQSKEGYIKNTIQEELLRLLKSDDELRRLNEIARDQSLKERDDETERQVQRQVARLLRIEGHAATEATGTQAPGSGTRRANPGNASKKPAPITPSEPPTFIRIVSEADAISFYAGQRRYVRIETDANSDYHDPDSAEKSRLNVAAGNDLHVFGTSPLQGGRMRIGIECKSEVAVGSRGSIRVELYRKGASALSDEREYEIVNAPQPRQGKNNATLPRFKIVPVDGPADENWIYLSGETDDRDVTRHASDAQMTEGVLHIYYSTVFPRFHIERKRLEQQNPVTAESFQRRYELWLAVHALLKHSDEETSDAANKDEDTAAELSRQERCRIATIAALISAQEVRTGLALDGDDPAV